MRRKSKEPINSQSKFRRPKARENVRELVNNV